jgi:uncharacterized protein YfdQ (DUF2303 family)
MNDRTIDPLTRAGASEAGCIASEMSALAAAALTPFEAQGARFVMLPPGFQQHDITAAVEKAQGVPNRKRGTVQVKDLASLLVALEDQAAQGAKDTGYVYADPDARTITAVFNDNRAGAGWRDYRVGFKAEYTSEFQRWLENNGANRAKGQTEFAEYVEDNLADIQEPFAQQLLEVATTIQATSGIDFKSAKRLQDGQTQLAYTENIDARAGSDGALSIPKEFALGLRIFKNGDGYKLKARLKYRLHSGSVKFWFELDRPERSVEDAFAGYVNQVREKSGYAVLLGTA